MEKLGIENMEKKKENSRVLLSLLRSSRVGYESREISIEAEKLEKHRKHRKGRTRFIPSDWNREREFHLGRKRGRPWVRGRSGQTGKGKDAQRRQPFSGDRDKPTAASEDRQSWLTEWPIAFQVVIQHMSTNGDNPEVNDKTQSW